MVIEGQVIRVQLAVDDVRVGSIISVRDVSERPINWKTLYKRAAPKRPRSGTKLIACRDLVSNKVFSFYQDNALSLESVGCLKTVALVLVGRIGQLMQKA